MIKNILLSTLAASFPMLTVAESIVLNCTTSDGQKAADLIIDLSNRTMTWSVATYDIVYEDDTYIIAYQRITDMGGEVWAIDRNTGEYHRGAVGIYYTEIPKPSDQGKFEAITHSGYCRKQQF